MYPNKKIKLDNYQYEDSESDASVIDKSFYEKEIKWEVVGENIQNDQFKTYYVYTSV